ncbi:MAG: hypothetical protein HY689_04780 [Chloroflexi bacterium]|nr:hypothetical protein [Chloroflexota bacterium]
MFERARGVVQQPTWEYKVISWNYEFASFRENGGDPFVFLSKEEEEIYFDRSHPKNEELRRDLIIKRDKYLADLLNNLGREGWELVNWEGGTYVFKRMRPSRLTE